MGTLVDRKQCPSCASAGRDNSEDNLAVYDDGSGYCFSCGHYENDKGESSRMTTQYSKEHVAFKPHNGSYSALSDRGITEKTARIYGYQIAKINGKDVHIANYYRDSSIVGQKLRGPDKTFFWKGSAKNAPLFGQNVWTNQSSNAKRLVITEGEIDAMTVNQLLNNSWPVVSVPAGAKGAARSIKDNLEFVTSYDEVVIMFDQDDPGREAAKEVAELLPPGKCRIASLPYKDANECLVKGEGKAVVNATWQAPLYSPDEILHVSNVIADTNVLEGRVYPFPYDRLTDFLIGQRSGEITLWTSGTGSGKSTILREMMCHHLEEGRSVGAIMLEESPQETIEDMISLLINKPVRAIKAARTMNELRQKMGKDPVDVEIVDDLTDEEYAQAREQLTGTSFYIYDHLGNNALQNLAARMEFMAVSLGVDVIVLDHITAAAVGMAGSNEKDIDGGGSERLIIDNLMKELRALVSRTGVRIDVVSQLKKTQKAYEEGDRITLQDLRGSGSLASVPNTVIALERDRQNENPVVANTTTIRVLKNRLTGRAGVASCLFYDRITGRTKEIDFAVSEDGQIHFEPVE
jgi:twinkle protein